LQQLSGFNLIGLDISSSLCGGLFPVLVLYQSKTTDGLSWPVYRVSFFSFFVFSELARQTPQHSFCQLEDLFLLLPTRQTLRSLRIMNTTAGWKKQKNVKIVIPWGSFGVHFL